ncbi:ABC transporter permease [Paenarthrobacter ureafaciens]|uniref:ABC transporter permease n=1 Tax=Paenarthrobacter TaxID=1742992 RepID=UPI0015BA2438|nr:MULTISPECIES: ABC transporter permease subunit [Paenarthrobacter]NWL26753.1 ABC transporter permease [Paenarthrobacter ureafaciens]NWL31977.1 ABC transporter permease [Paenarthrobacter nitroguajacolicus]
MTTTTTPPSTSRRANESPSALTGKKRSLLQIAVWVAVGFFLLNLAGIILSVIVNAFGTTWFKGPLPEGFTVQWFGQAWQDFNLGDVLITTLQVTFSVLALSLAFGVPAAYALARRDFPGKKLVMLLMLLPVMLPPITYGVPLATLMYQLQLAGSLTGVILVNLVPALPFVILVMTPFIGQLDRNLESAARMCGANTWKMFRMVLVPLLTPGILAAGVLILVRTVAMFELTFLVAGPKSETLIVALYSAAFSTGIRSAQTIDAMAVIYTVMTSLLLMIALRFVNPTQIVGQVKGAADDD